MSGKTPRLSILSPFPIIFVEPSQVKYIAKRIEQTQSIDPEKDFNIEYKSKQLK